MGTPTLPPIHARVAAGAALLDQRRPGWRAQVDPDRLDLLDWRTDILGQLYGTFGAGIHRLTPALSEAEMDAWTIAHGFDLHEVDLARAAGPVAAYRVLTEPWQAEVTRRRAGEHR
jgi:hypothetical protein